MLTALLTQARATNPIRNQPFFIRLSTRHNVAYSHVPRQGAALGRLREESKVGKQGTEGTRGYGKQISWRSLLRPSVSEGRGMEVRLRH
jgi:hypothetical protein